MRKFQKTFKQIADLSYNLRLIKPVVKEVIGDSNNNHRTLTVSQVIRYLNSGEVRGGKKLSVVISKVYEILKPYILDERFEATRRTDAIDINELVDTYRAVVLNEGKLRRTLGNALSKVG